MAYLFDLLIPAIVAAGFGAAAWWLQGFLIGPWLEFRRLRKQIHESLIFFANVLPNLREGQPVHDLDDALAARARNAEEELRLYAARLSALEESFARYHRWWARRRGLRITKAARALIGLSNSRGVAAEIRDHQVRMALKLPQELDDETFSEIVDRWREGQR